MNSFVDLAPFGLALGHATDPVGATGLTVVRGIAEPFRACATVVGRATGSRELAAASPEHLTDRVDAILLTGGSAYGLDAAAGVMRWMEERGRGFPVAGGVVPIVPAAVLFDLAPLGRFGARPTPDMAYTACDAAESIVRGEGSVGAGTGATVGKSRGAAYARKGGIGCAVRSSDDLRVAAIAAVNAFGDVCDAHGAIVDSPSIASLRAAGAYGAGTRVDGNALDQSQAAPPAMQNTTLAVVAVDRPLDRVALAQLARAATAALYRRVVPCGTSFDGDVVFAVCPLPSATRTDATDHATALLAEQLAVSALEDAIERGVRLAGGA